MKKLCARMVMAAGLALSAIFAFSASAEEVAAGNIKACFVDLQEVLRSLPEYSSAKETLEGIAKEKQKMVSEKEKEIQKLDKAMKQDLLRSEDAKKEKETEFKSKLNDYQDMVKQIQAELADKEEELLSPVKEMLSKAIESVSKEKGFNLVFDAAAPAGRPILYIDDSLDITESVIKKVKEWSNDKGKMKEEMGDKDKGKK